jgi:3-methyladenine DNA glycosylase AlkD
MIADALAELQAAGDPARAAEMAAYHKTKRRCLGVAVPLVSAMADGWRAACTLDDRLTLAAALWQTDIHEARVAAAKLLTQARIRPDAAAWALIQSWVPDFDGWALADHVCIAGQKRLVADLSRLDAIESWTTSPHMWTRRAALVITLPFAKSNIPKPSELAARDRVLGWAAGYADDRDWFIQKAVSWWVRDLSKHDAPRARAFLAEHGARLKPFAAKEAAKYLTP